jgi:hypothetical protein
MDRYPYNFHQYFKVRNIFFASLLLTSKILLCVRKVGAPSSSEDTGITHWKLRNGDVVPASEYSNSAIHSSLKATAHDSMSPITDPIFGILLGLDHSERLLNDLSPAPGNVKRCTVSRVATSENQGMYSEQSVVDKCKSPNYNCEGECRIASSSNCGVKLAKFLICSDVDVEVTKYDFLEGIAKRKYHRSYPEPEVAMIFRKSDSDDAIDLWEVEHRLKVLLKENSQSSNVFNQIGNYWRIKGNTFQAIECFRKALTLKPENSDVLLNLARVLFNLNYHDDAIFLTKESLKKSNSPQETWLQHYTLGEIYKAMGKYQDSSEHLKKALEINPSFQAAEVHLRELKSTSSIHANLYTILIIVFLIIVVLVVIHRLIITNY